MKKILLILLALCLVVGLVACNREAEVYSLTFDPLGGGETTVIKSDGEIAFPADPQREGYLFDGWFYDKDVWEKQVSIELIRQTGIPKDITVYAKWTALPPVVQPEDKPDVAFDARGGSKVATLSDTDRIVDEPVTSKAGYAFLGWYKSVNDQNKVVFPYVPETDVTLIAKWRIINYAITYNLDGGSASNPATYNIETGRITFVQPIRTGYTFAGWYSDSNFATQVTTVEAGTTGNLHFFAKWQINTYNVIYYVDDAPYVLESGDPAVYSFEYGAALPAAIQAPQKTGNDFSGWKLANDSEILPTAMPASDLIIYGKFTPHVYQITYYLNDAVYGDVQKVPYGARIDYKAAPQRQNSRFSGWTVGESVPPITMPAYDIEVKGVFTDTFDLIYIVDGTEYYRETLAYGAAVTAAEAPQKTGYAFSGWTGLPASMPASDIEVTGSLAPRVYLLTFKTAEEDASVVGLPGEDESIEVSFDENFIYRLNGVTAERFAYDFAGWTLNGAPFAPAKWDSTADLTVFAAWTEKHTQGLKYTQLGDGSYSVTGYSGLSAEVFIPSSYNGYAVKTIAATAFRNNALIESVTIHNGLVRLGGYSFENCVNLKTVNLPASIQNIEAETFNGCSSLTNFEVPAGVGVIGNAPFRGCSSLAAVTVAAGNTVYKALDGVLYSASGKSLIQFPEGKTVSSFVIPNSVETLGNYAFNNCASLTEITFGANVNSIGCYAFAGTSVTEMTISNMVTWIGSNAFDRCTYLTKLSLPFVGSSKAEAETSEGVFGYIFGNSYFEGSTAANQWYNAVNYATYYLPSALIEVSITDSEDLPFGAFSNCTRLEIVALTNVVRIGEKAFYGCGALRDVSLPRSLTGIDIDAFNGCISLGSLQLPVSLTFIGDMVFHNCPALTSYEPAEGVADKYYYVVTPSDDPDIADGAYIVSYEGSLGDNARAPEMLENNRVVSVGRIFQNVSGVYTVGLSSEIKTLDRHAFDGSGYLAIYAKAVAKPVDWTDRWDDPAIYWGVGYDDIYMDADGFSYYVVNNEAIVTRYLGTASDVEIPRTMDLSTPVVGIGKYAFAGNQNIERVQIPASIRTIGTGAFADCQSLLSIEVDSLSQYFYSDANGVLYNRTSTRLIQFPAGRANVTDGGVRMYADFTVPATVETIAAEAFTRVNLERITFTGALKSIEPGAFSGCAALVSVIYLNMTQITGIPEKAFYGCENLVSLTLPTTVRTIGDGAFSGCAKLASLNGNSGLRLASFAYLSAIGNGAFAGCAALTGVTLPSSLITIGYSAFSNCAGIPSIVVPDSVLSIGNAAFAGCSSLVTAALSSNLTRIANLMFAGCTSLQSLTVPFVGSSIFAKDSEDAVFGYLFGYSKTAFAGAVLQRYGAGSNDIAYYAIPSSLRYLSVTNAAVIPYGAFSNLNTVIDIEIASTVKTIDKMAFAGCSALQNLVLPFIGGSRAATGANALLGYFFEETDASDSSAVLQVYGDGQEGRYRIPAGLANMTVTDATTIGRGALSNLASLRSVTFNPGIISIGAEALRGCNALETLEIPFVGSSRSASGTEDAVFGYLFGTTDDPAEGTLQLYSLLAFDHYRIPSGITEVVLTSAEALPYGAFSNLSVASIILNDGLETIGDMAFLSNPAITELTLPNSVTAIGNSAFMDCVNLGYVSLGRVQTIGDNAFSGAAIVTLNLPDSLTTIGNGAFSSMSSLQTVSVSVYNSNLSSIGRNAFKDDSALQTITLPNRLTNLGSSIFAGCVSLTRVSLPFLGATSTASGTADAMFGYLFDTDNGAGLVQIGQSLANGSTVDYYIPASLTYLILTNASAIGAGALSGIPDLTVTLNEGVSQIDEYAFYRSGISAITIPASVTEICDSAFEESELVSITFASGSKLSTIGQKAFFGTSYLTAFAVPASVVTIENEAFCNETSSLLSLTFHTNSLLQTVGDYAFYGNDRVTSLILPASLMTIGAHAFENCAALASLSVRTNAALHMVGDYAFANTSAGEVTLPQTVVSIGNYAFAYSSLTQIDFGVDSLLQTIGDYAFAYSNLSTFTIPSGLNYIGVNPFYETPVAGLYLSGYRSGYKVISGVLFTKDGSVLISYPKSLSASSYTVPDGVVRVDAYAFARNTSIKTVSLPQSLLSIGFSAFEDCNALTSVDFRGDAGLLVIEENAFAYCAALTLFSAPASLVRVEDRAFFNTFNLDAADFSHCARLISIGESAFKNSGIAAVSLPASLESIGEYAFANTDLYSVNWENLTGLAEIPDYAFTGCISLPSVVIPASVQRIGNSAFYNCIALVSLRFAEDSILADIGNAAFKNTAIISLELPDSLQTLGALAFDTSTLKIAKVPFIGNSAAPSGEYNDSFAYVFGVAVGSIENLNVSNSRTNVSVSSGAFSTDLLPLSLASVTFGEGVVSVAEGVLAGAPIVSLNLGFVGASADATGREGLLGYLFGFSETASAGTVTQRVSDVETVFARIPSSLVSITVGTAQSYGAFSGIASLTNLTVKGGTALGQNLIADCTSLVSLSLPFAGASADAAGAEGRLRYLTDGTLPGLREVTLTAATVLDASAFDIGALFTTIRIGGAVESLPEGLLAPCVSLINLTVPFAGASANATGKNGLLGYLFGFKSSLTAASVIQLYGADAAEFAYSEIPQSLDSVTLTAASAVGYGCFSNLTELRTVEIKTPASVGDKAFYRCERLQSVVVSGSAKILSVGDYAFYGAAFESVVISADVTSIGAYAFADCENLTSVVFESGSQLLSVGNFAFADCDSLKNITLPEGILTFGDGVFAGCQQLISAVIPATVTAIGTEIFKDCINLSELSVPFAGASAISAETGKLGYFFDQSASNATVPSALVSLALTHSQSIYASAFEGTHLTSVTLNEGLIVIYAAAFRGVPVESILLPATVTHIDNYAFFGSGLRSFAVTAGSVLDTLGDYVFQNNSLLADVVLPDSLTAIGQNAFAGCLLNVRFSVPFVGASRTASGANAVLGYFFETAASGVTQKYGASLTNVFAIPATLRNVAVTSATSIGYGAFSGCASIVSLSVNNGVTSFGAFALEGCTRLESLTLPYAGASVAAPVTQATMKYLFGDAAGSGIAHVTSLRITGAVIVNTGAFAGMAGLTSVVLNDGITSIGQGAFAGCLALRSMTVPFIGSKKLPTAATEQILGYWFEQKTASGAGIATQYYMNNGVETPFYAVLPASLDTLTLTDASRLYYGALSGMTALRTLTVNRGVSEMGQNVLKNSVNVETLTIPFVGKTPGATSDTEVKLSYIFGGSPANLKVVNVTAAVKIGQYAFANNTKIISVNLNEGITSIGNFAFTGMTSLTSAMIPSTVKTIGSGAFSGCTAVTSIVFAPGATVTTISENAFENTAITSLVIPDSVNTIGAGALEGCFALTRLTTPFVGMNRTATAQYALLGYMFGLVSSPSIATTTQIYSDENSQAFAILPDNLYEIHLTSAYAIGYGAFYNCSELTSLILNSGITAVGRLAFANCSGLTSLAIPDSVNAIAYAAFSGCSSLVSLSLPFAGTSRTETGVTALFGYVFGAAETGAAGATEQYFNATSSRIYYIPETLRNVRLTSASSLGYGVFYNMNKVMSIEINEGIAAIPQKAFYRCSAVVSLTVPSSVTSVAAGALQGMTSLQSLSLPFAGESASATGASALFGVIFGTAGEYAPDVVRQVYAAGASTQEILYNIPYALRYVTLTRATEIKAYTFYNCSNIATLTLGQNITSIGDYAFANASSLSALYGDLSALVSIGDSAFENCRSFLGIDLSQSLLLEHIGSRAFEGCISLNFVNLPLLFF